MNNKFSIKNNYPVLLASKSAMRRKMLKSTGLKFKIVPSRVDEKEIKAKYTKKSFNFIATKLANEKAKTTSKLHKDFYVIGADQICVYKNIILSKPITKKKAIKQLAILNGSEHRQISAFSIYLNDKLIGNYCDTAILKMRKLTLKNIQDYVNCEEPLQSCGAYKYESKGMLLFANIDGCIDTVKGLPLLPLLELMHKNRIIKYA